MEVIEALFWLILLYITYKLCDYIYRFPWIGRLTTRRVFITGCDSGFGYLISKRLDSKGVYVFSGCLTEAGEERLKKECSGRIKTLRVDVTNEQSVRKAYDYVKKYIPEDRGLWGMINNAGIARHAGPVEWLSTDQYKEVLNVNLLGLIDTAVTFLPLLKKAKGRVVNTASMMGRHSSAFSSTYTVSKFGVECFSDAIRRQLKDFEVSVHLIEPGFYKTDMGTPDNFFSMIKKTWQMCPKEVQQEYGKEYADELAEFSRDNISKLASEKVDEVVDAYEHALLARHPRDRYLLGKDANYFIIPVSGLPEWLSDFLFLGFKRPVPKCMKKPDVKSNT